MGDKSKIEWTEASWNAVVGCSRVSSGCDNCYAIRQAHRIQSMGSTDAYDGTTRRTGRGRLDWTGVVKCLPERLDQPLRWTRPRRIFVNSMSDLFHPTVPFEFIDRVFAVMALASQHTFQILTKRPERMAEYLNRAHLQDKIDDDAFQFIKVRGVLTQVRTAHRRINAWVPVAVKTWPLPNVWLGTSVENQAAADERIPHLLRCPAAVRWLSCEPLLGPVDLDRFLYWIDDAGYTQAHTDLHWIVVGGESGPGARPMKTEWARLLIYQARRADVAAFMKQLGSVYARNHNMSDGKGHTIEEFPPDLRVREYPEPQALTTP